MNQYDFKDSQGYADFAERTYIYNTMSFQLVDDARFVINPDGTRYIADFAVVPREDVIENFDMDGGNLLTDLLNLQLERYNDPSEIGRTVNIEFAEEIETKSYTLADYNADLAKIGTWTTPSLATLRTEMNKLIDSLWDSGITEYLAPGNKPILYGTDGANTITEAQISLVQHPTLYEFKNNGVVLIGGKGGDFLTGGDQADVLLAGSGADELRGGGGADVLYDSLIGKGFLTGTGYADKLYGDAGNDTLVSRDGVDTIDYSAVAGFPDGLEINLSEGVSTPRGENYGVPLDVLDNFEYAIGTPHRDIIIGNAADNSLEGGAGVDILFGRTGSDTLKGGDDTDGISGGGAPEGKLDYLYGGGGADIFEFGNRSVIADATTEDFVSWGGATWQITGGVQQFWQEGNWAYYTPFSGIVASGGGMGLLSDLLYATSVLTDLAAGANFRFGLTESNQLLIQIGRGRAANDNAPLINKLAA